MKNTKIKTPHKATLRLTRSGKSAETISAHRENGLGLLKPRRAGDIIIGMLSSDSPLARGYRVHLAQKENVAEKGGAA